MPDERRTKPKHESVPAAWHRPKSIERFVGTQAAKAMKQIDVDATIWVEFAGRCDILLLIEYAYDTGQDLKFHHVLQRLAERADVPALVVLYKNHPSRRSPSNNSKPDIASFRVKWIYPKLSASWMEMTPRAYAKYLDHWRFKAAARNLKNE